MALSKSIARQLVRLEAKIAKQSQGSDEREKRFAERLEEMDAEHEAWLDAIDTLLEQMSDEHAQAVLSALDELDPEDTSLYVWDGPLVRVFPLASATLYKAAAFVRRGQSGPLVMPSAVCDFFARCVSSHEQFGQVVFWPSGTVGQGASVSYGTNDGFSCGECGLWLPGPIGGGVPREEAPFPTCPHCQGEAGDWFWRRDRKARFAEMETKP